MTGNAMKIRRFCAITTPYVTIGLAFLMGCFVALQLYHPHACAPHALRAYSTSK